MKTIRVVAAVIRKDDRIFATQRGYGEFKDGWEFPGGKIEPGETPQQALVREIREELETEIRVGDLIDTIEYDYPTFHLSMDCFWCEVVACGYYTYFKNREDDEVTCFAIDLQLFDVVGEYDGAAAAGDVEFEELQCEGFVL